MSHPPVNVSVCMATYNGAKYLTAQLDSILEQLGADDEIVIVDDASTDATRELLAGIQDPRVRVILNDANRGYVRTFERALGEAQGEVILLSDQDDVWLPGRVDAMASALRTAPVVATNLVYLGSGERLASPLTGRPWFLREQSSGHGLRNEVTMLAGNAPYFGCAMGITRPWRDVVLPFPEILTESHDLWIATTANAAGRMRHLEQDTIQRRIHDDNASPSKPRGVVPALRSRWLLIRLWFEARRRVRAAR